MPPRPFEIDVQRLRMVILAHAQKHDLDTGVVVAALADTLGLCAAVLDRQAGHVPLETRMESFLERTKAAYERTTRAQTHAIIGQHVRQALRA